MHHWKCTKCHHEWDGPKEENKCDWCNAAGKPLGPYPTMDYDTILKRLWPKGKSDAQTRN